MRNRLFIAGLVVVVLCMSTQSHAQGKNQAKGKTNRAEASSTAKQINGKGNKPVSSGKTLAEEKSTAMERADKQVHGQGQKQASSGKALAEEKKTSALEASNRGDKAVKRAGNKASQERTGSGRGKNKLQKNSAFAKQIQHEEAKHLERQARLTRILELATEKKDSKMIERVHSLMKKEQARYTKTSERLQAKSQQVGVAETTAQVIGESQKNTSQKNEKDETKDKGTQSSERDNDKKNSDDARSDHNDQKDAEE